MMNRAQTYRHYAADCLALANRLSDGPDRQLLIEMAAGWHELSQLLSVYMEQHDGREPEFDGRDQPEGDRDAH